MSLYRVSSREREWFVDLTGTTSLANFPEHNAFVGFTPDGQLYIGDRQGKIVLMEPVSQAVTQTLELGPPGEF